MTITDFFFSLTPDEIKQKFVEKGISTFKDFPKDERGFEETFGLEPDDKVKYVNVKIAEGESEDNHSDNPDIDIHIFSIFPNPAWPEYPFNFDSVFELWTDPDDGEVHFDVRDAMNQDEEIHVYQKEDDTFDERPEYNNIDVKVCLGDLKDIAYSYKNYDGSLGYSLSHNKTLQEMYESLCRYVYDLKRYVDLYVNSLDNGSFFKTWNKYCIGKKLEKGSHYTMISMLASNMINVWKRMADLDNSYECHLTFDKWVELFYGVVEQVIPNYGVIYSIVDKEFKDGVLNIISKVEELNNDTDLTSWCKTYKAANEKFLTLQKKAREDIAREFGINPRYVDTSIAFPYVDWNRDKVPEDAYSK